MFALYQLGIKTFRKRKWHILSIFKNFSFLVDSRDKFQRFSKKVLLKNDFDNIPQLT